MFYLLKSNKKFLVKSYVKALVDYKKTSLNQDLYLHEMLPIFETVFQSRYYIQKGIHYFLRKMLNTSQHGNINLWIRALVLFGASLRNASLTYSFRCWLLFMKIQQFLIRLLILHKNLTYKLISFFYISSNTIAVRNKKLAWTFRVNTKTHNDYAKLFQFCKTLVWTLLKRV